MNKIFRVNIEIIDLYLSIITAVSRYLIKGGSFKNATSEASQIIFNLIVSLLTLSIRNLLMKWNTSENLINERRDPNNKRQIFNNKIEKTNNKIKLKNNNFKFRK